MVKISFLVTYYNQAQYVNDSLGSISKINIPCEYEVVVGNDGSTDSTMDEINKWNEFFGDRLIIFTADRNDGVKDNVIRASNLRRELYRRSKGDFYCVLDGDDFYCDTEFVSEAINIFKQLSDVSVVMFNHRMYYSDHIDEINSSIPEGLLEASKYIRRYYCGSGACVFRNIDNIEFRESMDRAVYYDDNDIPILNLNFGEAFHVDRSIINYRQHGDSTWNSMDRVEQGVINVLGADNEMSLASKYKNDILYRYRKDILFTYFRRKKLSNYLNNNKLERYRKIASNLQSLSKVLIDFENTGEEERKEVDNYIKKIDEMDHSEHERIMSITAKEGNRE